MPGASSASGPVARASDARSNATGRAPSTNDASRLDEAAGFRGAAAASVGGSASPRAVDQADALRAAWAQGADLAATDLPEDLEVGLGEARAAQARPSWEGRGRPWPQRTACDVSAFRH
jgi:hypothetical protein